MKLRVLPFGVSVGLVWGLIIFIATAIVLIKGGGQTLILLKVYYWGFSVSWPGSLAGLLWGFLNGLLVGIVIAIIYNLFAGGKET